MQILDGGESTIQFMGPRKAIMDEEKPRTDFNDVRQRFY